MKLYIRDARPDDAETVVRFNQYMALETERRRLDEELISAGVSRVLSDATKGRYFIAELEGEIAGQLMITYEWSDWRNGDFWWIQSVFVREDMRRRGVFSALFRHVQELVETNPDVCGLRLYAERENEAAKAVYVKLGMRETVYDMFEQEFPR